MHLLKGQSVKLNKDITLAFVGFNFQLGRYDGEFDFDLDMSAFLLGKSGIVRSNSDFVFYGNMEHNSGSLLYTGDSIGGTDFDDEQVYIDLRKVPSDIDKIVFTVTIYEAEARKQNFGQVTGAYIRLVRVSALFDISGTEVLRFDLGEDFSTETGIAVCEICRSGSEWAFHAVGAGYQGGLEAFCKNFGVAL